MPLRRALRCPGPRLGVGLALGLGLASCASAPAHWSHDAAATLAAARAAGGDVAVFFALPGREQSDRMERECLGSPAVAAALARGGFRALRLDARDHGRLQQHWVAGVDGMGVGVLDGRGEVYAARPGPQDADELAAFLDLAAARRGRVSAMRGAVAARPGDARAQYELGCALLELGCRRGTEECLLAAAQGGVLDAHHRLARLHALDGDVARARQWLRTAPPSPAARVTEAYVQFKERRHAEAAAAFAAVLEEPGVGDDAPRARLYLGKALHEAGRDVEARAVLRALAIDAAGTIFGAAAEHTLSHMQEQGHGHSH